MYIPRNIEPLLKQYLNAFVAVAITGPRQSGKSTLLKEILNDYQYVSFDDPQMVYLFEEDPMGFLSQYQDRVIFDEVQRVPEIFHYIKILIDEDRSNYGKFVLTGSAQFSLVKNISESLAGRIGLLTLLPFQYSEIPEAVRNSAILQGSYPELVNRNYLMKNAWYASYVETYLQKDVRLIQNVGDLRGFHRLLNLLAANVSQELNYSTYANDLGVSVNTIKRWVSVLEASYIIFLLPPYYENFGKRITKSPKVYFYDTGLVTFLTGIETQKQYENGPMSGALFENYIVSEINKKFKHSEKNADLYYYRVHRSTEIDLIIDGKTFKHFVEIKKQTSFAPKMVKHLKALFEGVKMEGHDQGKLIYSGNSVRYSINIDLVNYQDYLLS